MTTLLAFIVTLGLLIVVHEYGHYRVAVACGVNVLRFSVGFGRTLWSRQRGETEFVVALLPLGGYVRMLDERDGAVSPEDLPRAFASRPPWQRILVLLAGPAANILFAILLLWAMFMADSVTEVKPVIGEVTTGSIAASAGLRAGDEIRLINGTPIRDQTDASIELLDAISDQGIARLAVRGKDGSERTVVMSVADPVARRKLTEPIQLNPGLGFHFWRVTIPALLEDVEAGGPADKAGLKPGDLVVGLDGQQLPVPNQLVAVDAGGHVGHTAVLAEPAQN